MDVLRDSRMRRVTWVGALAFAGALGLAGYSVFAGETESDVVDYLLLAAVAAIVAGVIFGVVVPRRLRGASNGAGAAIVLAVFAAAAGAFAFWTGLAAIFGGGATLLGRELLRSSTVRRGGRAASVVAMAVGIAAIPGSWAMSVSDNLSHRPNRLDVRGSEYTFSMPPGVKGGMVTFDVFNAGREIHMFEVVRLAGGRSERDVLEYLRSETFRETGDQPDWLEPVGGVAPIGPGVRTKLAAPLQPGRYAFLCALPNSQGKTHAELGMIREFVVAGRSGALTPREDATITVTDDGFRVPRIGAGRVTLRLRNESTRSREFAFMGLLPGKTSADVDTWYESGAQGTPPAVFPGGVLSIPPRTVVFVEMELRAGLTYLLQDTTNPRQALETRFTVD